MKLNPNSSEHQRLESALVVTPSVNTVKPNSSSVTQGKPRQAGEMNFFTYLNPLERDLVLPNYKAFPVSSETALKAPIVSRSAAGTARAPRQAFRATHATTRAIQRLATTEETPVGKRAFVREEGLNLREKPDQTSSSLAKLAFGTRVLVASKNGAWYRVTTETGKSGYVLAAKIHGLQAPHQALLEADPGLRLFKVKPGETGMQLVRRAYGITGAEGSKDQNLWHFLNAIRKRNQTSAFGYKDLGWADAAQNAMVAGADANNVMLRANTDLWIPSFAIAARDNTVGSGTLSGEARRLGKNIEQKVKDFQAAQTYAGQAMGTVFQKRLEEGAKELLEGLVTALIAAAAVLVGTTAIGAIIGAVAGGGVGAAPGAALGFQVGTWLLQWLGLGFLVAWGAGKLTQVFGAFGSFVTKVWNANGDQKQLKEAGVALADALAILAVAALQILVTMGVAKGLGAVMKGLAGSRFGRGIGIPRLQAYLRLKLKAVNQTAGSTPTTARLQQGLRETAPRAVAARVQNPLKPLSVTSVVIDSNAAIALQKQAAGLPLQAGELAIINRFRAMGNVDLRVAGTTVAEVRGGQVQFKGFPLEVARSSRTYQDLLKVLEKFKVGKNKGIADRMIVADTFFAKVEPGAKITFATMDSGIYNPLLQLANLDPKKLGMSAPEKFPNGFDVTIMGRTITVIPLPKK